MTCNFKNSAGTDLDDLFYTNNGNAGALGFKNSSGTDLGNKYSDKSVLGYAVGYKNSAGTDMGYLRGNMSAASSVTPSSTSLSVTRFWWCTLGESNVDTYVWDYTYSGTLTFDQEVSTVKVTVDDNGNSNCGPYWQGEDDGGSEPYWSITGNGEKINFTNGSSSSHTFSNVNSSTFTLGVSRSGCSFSIVAGRSSYPISLTVTLEVTNDAGTSTLSFTATTNASPDWGGSDGDNTP